MTVIRILRPVPLTRLVEQFADRLLAVDLPALTPERRAKAVSFTGGRIATLPSPMRFGLTIVAFVVAGGARLVGLARVARLLAGRPLPVVGDYVRLVRSLAYTYVWETWPSTGPDGASG